MFTDMSIKEKFGKAASQSNGRVHVVPIKDGWAVKKEGNKIASSVKSTKSSAVSAAKSVVGPERIIIHKKDGTIQYNKKK
jgi:hypothetical protein